MIVLMKNLSVSIRNSKMAVSKFSLFIVAMIIASNYSPVCGQAVRTPQDFWISFAERIGTNVINWILNADIFPDDPTPSSPAARPQISVITQPQQPQTVTPAPMPNQPSDPTSQFIQTLLALSGGNIVPRPTPAPATGIFVPGVPAPATGIFVPGVPAPNNGPFVPGVPAPAPAPCHTTPKCSACQPEKVRIVVVDDCKDCKDESHSSESCSHEESSEEVNVIMPRGRYSKSSKY